MSKPEQEVIQVLESHPGGLYSDDLAARMDMTERELRLLLRRCKRYLPHGRKISALQVSLFRGMVRVTRYYLALDFRCDLKAQQVPLFKEDPSCQ